MSHSWYSPSPYGVMPRGNAPQKDGGATFRLGTLTRLAYLGPDGSADVDTLLELIFAFSSVEDVCRATGACSALYIIAHASDFWRRAHAAFFPRARRTIFAHDWKTTVVRRQIASMRRPDADEDALALEVRRDFAGAFRHAPICPAKKLYCDELFAAHLCLTIPCDYKLTKLPSATATPPAGYTACGGGYATRFVKPVARVENLSAEEFYATYEEKNEPVVLRGAAKNWPLFKLLAGDLTNLAKRAGDIFTADRPMRCEHTTMRVAEYVAYATEQRDERPVYLFDSAPPLAPGVFEELPHFARDDFFQVLGAAHRPDYRWLIAGPARGGSAFHTDPNCTSAYNACLTGSKRWLFFPPHAAPPGVVPSADRLTVATPVSLGEWLFNHYEESVAVLRGVGREVVAEAGDIVWVPAGWWHFVINLEPSVALTQNYVSRANLRKVLIFLRAMKGGISGVGEDECDNDDDADAKPPTCEPGASCRVRDSGIGGGVRGMSAMMGAADRRLTLADDFSRAMRAAHPELMARVEAEIEAAAAARQERKRQREVASAALAPTNGGFTFDF